MEEKGTTDTTRVVGTMPLGRYAKGRCSRGNEPDNEAEWTAIDVDMREIHELRDGEIGTVNLGL